MGLGGGLLLIALMPSFLPPLAVVPIHGVVQLASNASRTAFDWRSADWRIVGAFCVGAVVGGVLGAPLVAGAPVELLPVLLGAFILVLTWLPKSWLPTAIPGQYVTAGALQTVLSLFVGATGPINGALLSRAELGRDRTVVTHGGMMTALHLAKILTFAWVGFAFAPYALLLVAMVTSSTLGSLAGTRLRGRLPQAKFQTAFKALITILALRLVLTAVW